MSSGLEFKPYVVAYLDILGFKQFVEDAEHELSKSEKLAQLFDEVIPRQISTEQNNKSFPHQLGMKCLSVSDSIVISVPVNHSYSPNYSALTAVSIKSIQITHALLEMGLLVRGAIAVGNAHRTETNILGSGYQAAVAGENKAVHPQILLTESAITKLYEDIEGGGEKFSIFAKNEEGQIIIDGIYSQHPSYWRDANGETWEPVKYDNEAVERFKIYRRIIEDNLQHDDSKARGKWIWFARLFNANVRYFSHLRNQSLEIKEEAGLTMNFLNPTEENSDWMNQFKAPAFKVTINNGSL